MKNIFNFAIFFILINYFSISKSYEIKNIVSVNSYVITNVDLINEMNFYEILENRKINFEKEKFIFLNYLIENTIKENELKTSFKNIKISNTEILGEKEKIIKSIQNNLNELDDNRKKKFYKFLEKNIKISKLWNKAIILQFGNLAIINQSEIDEIANDKNLSEEDKKKLTILEKNKSYQNISKTYLNLMKTKYLIRYY